MRVGILAKTLSCGATDICARWVAPIEKAGLQTLYIPVGGQNIDEILPTINGLLLPGGDSNIHPAFYDSEIIEDELSDDEERDIERDRTAIALIQKAYDLDLPTLGICRGMQEMIVAFGGQLQKLDFSTINHAAGYAFRQNRDGMDRRVHDITLKSGGFMDEIYDTKTLAVNSIHYEGITEKQWASIRNEHLKQRFRIEATAPDGVIEGISARNRHFMMGVQAHFELEGPLHEALFTLFFDKIHIHVEKT